MRVLNITEARKTRGGGLISGEVYNRMHRCQVFWLVWSEKMLCPEGARVRPEGPNV